MLTRTVFGRLRLRDRGRTRRRRATPASAWTASASRRSCSAAWRRPLAGVIDASTVSSGGNDSGASLVLASIAAVALGGTSIFGGIGAIWRTVLGVRPLAMIANGFDLLRHPRRTTRTCSRASSSSWRSRSTAGDQAVTVKVIWTRGSGPILDKAVARGHWRDVDGVLGGRRLPGLDSLHAERRGRCCPAVDRSGRRSTVTPRAGRRRRRGRPLDGVAVVAAIGAESATVRHARPFWGMSAFVDEHVVVAPPTRRREGRGDREVQGRRASGWVSRTEALLGDVPGLIGRGAQRGGRRDRRRGPHPGARRWASTVRGVLVRGPGQR